MALFTFLLFALLLHTCSAENLSNVTDTKHQRPAQNDVVAFSAELSASIELSPGSIIVFDRVLTNAGERYFGTTGQFACVDGLYVFVWNFKKQHVPELEGMRCIGSLRSGGVDRKYGPKTSYYSMTHGGVSEMTTVLECGSDPSSVSIHSERWAEGVGSTSVFYPVYTSFSGFKLLADVAFTVELEEDQRAFPGGRVMFDKVLANHGGQYKMAHGYFRCPDDGVYVFSISAYTRDPSTPWSVSRLMMEMEVVMQGPMTYLATEAYDSGTASTTSVLQCTEGFSVYVEAQAAHDFPHNSYGAELTSFTGFKLYNVTPEAVAFTVVLTQNVTATAGVQPIPFDQVITNIGGAFNISASSFVCPDDAYYMFTWSVVSPASRIFMHLHMNGTLVKRLRTDIQTDSDSTGTSGSNTQSVILQCQPGTTFQTVSNDADFNFVGNFTSFSGYKIPG